MFTSIYWVAGCSPVPLPLALAAHGERYTEAATRVEGIHAAEDTLIGDQRVPRGSLPRRLRPLRSRLRGRAPDDVAVLRSPQTTAAHVLPAGRKIARGRGVGQTNRSAESGQEPRAIAGR